MKTLYKATIYIEKPTKLSHVFIMTSAEYLRELIIQQLVININKELKVNKHTEIISHIERYSDVYQVDNYDDLRFNMSKKNFNYYKIINYSDVIAHHRWVSIKLDNNKRVNLDITNA